MSVDVSISGSMSIVLQSFGSVAAQEDRGPVIVTTVSGSAESLAAVGVVALASPELNVGFGRCRWEKCGRFFLEAGVRRGKKGRDYCPDLRAR